MDNTSWLKQTSDKPLFDDLVWSRPINKKHRGSLLIVGGNQFSINAPSAAFSEALKQGVGSVTALLPDKTAKYFGSSKPPEVKFVPSSLSGSFGQEAFEPIKSYSLSSTATLLAGDFGKNSETQILIEKLATLSGRQVYCHDSLECFTKNPELLLDRDNTLLILSFVQLQKYVIASGFDKPITSDISLVNLVELLQQFSRQHKCILLTKHGEYYLVVTNGMAVSTKIEADKDVKNWFLVAAAAAVWWLQNPTKALQAISASLLQL